MKPFTYKEYLKYQKKKYQKKFPEAITIQGKIPIWYFNEVQGLRKKED